MLKPTWKVLLEGRGYSTSEILSKLWRSRNIENPEEFINPKGFILPSSDFEGIEDAAKVFIDAIRDSKKFLIYADVDADGCSSAAIMYHYLQSHEADVEIHINKEKHHGIQEYFFTEYSYEYDILVIVDSINDTMEYYQRILDAGKTLIVLDHHVPKQEVLDNASLIHLVSSAVNYGNPHLSGSGVTWKFVSYVDKKMKTKYAKELVDLAAIGLIADVCSVGAESMENREICNMGFKGLKNLGVRTLLNATEMDSDSISFSIAPLINAANRLNHNVLALSLFTCSTVEEAKKIIKQLTKIKDEQKSLVASLFKQLEEDIYTQTTESCLYFIPEQDPGSLAGLLATKAVSRWNRPCLVLHDCGETYEGSMRAIGIDDFQKVLNESGLCVCSGHENSAGIVIPKQNLDKLKEHVDNTLQGVQFEDHLVADISIDRCQITPVLLKALKGVNRISGAGFSPIKFVIQNVRGYTVKALSQGKHLCVDVPDMKFLYWNIDNWQEVEEEGTLSAVGNLSESFFCGKKSVQMIMEDFMFEVPLKAKILW